jgi:hypothetical protein
MVAICFLIPAFLLVGLLGLGRLEERFLGPKPPSLAAGVDSAQADSSQ